MTDRHLRMDIVSRGGRQDAQNLEYRDKSILLHVTHADSLVQTHQRGGSADHDGPTASTSEACKREHYARPRHVLLRTEPQIIHFRGGKF